MILLTIPDEFSLVDVFNMSMLLAEHSESRQLCVDKETISKIKNVANTVHQLKTPQVLGDILNNILSRSNPERGLSFLAEAEVLEAVLPELNDCRGVEQNIEHHPDDVFTHCVKVCSLVEGEDDILTLRWAGLLHDIGKKEVRAKDKNGKVTFHNHHLHSERISKRVLSRFFPGENKFIEDVCKLVGLHMYYYSSEWTDKAIRRFVTKVGLKEKDIETLSNIPLFRLRAADRVSRSLPSMTPKQEDFEARLREFLKRSYKQT